MNTEPQRQCSSRSGTDAPAERLHPAGSPRPLVGPDLEWGGHVDHNRKRAPSRESSDEHEGLSKRADARRVLTAERLRLSRQDRCGPWRTPLFVSGIRGTSKSTRLGLAESGTRQA